MTDAYIIDTHCHLIDEAFQPDLDETISRALTAGVSKMLLACCCEEEFRQIQNLCQRYPDTLYASIGIHPENMEDDVRSQWQSLAACFDTSNPVVACGEIGIDLHWDSSRLDDQLWLLEAQIDWALDHDLPLLLHIRDAMPVFLQCCKERLLGLATAKGKRLRGILHCYSGNIKEAEEALQYGDFLFGVGGTLTYKKSQVPEVAKAIGIERIVLETDAPYLAPVPHRGRRNEPAYTAETCRALAEILSLSPEKVAQKTTENALQLLQLA